MNHWGSIPQLTSGCLSRIHLTEVPPLRVEKLKYLPTNFFLIIDSSQRQVNFSELLVCLPSTPTLLPHTHRQSTLLQPEEALGLFQGLAMGSHQHNIHRNGEWKAKVGKGPGNVFFVLYINTLHFRFSQVDFLSLVISAPIVRPLRNEPWKLSLEEPTCDMSLYTVLTRAIAGKEKRGRCRQAPNQTQYT